MILMIKKNLLLRCNVEIYILKSIFICIEMKIILLMKIVKIIVFVKMIIVFWNMILWKLDRLFLLGFFWFEWLNKVYMLKFCDF